MGHHEPHFPQIARAAAAALLLLIASSAAAANGRWGGFAAVGFPYGVQLGAQTRWNQDLSFAVSGGYFNVPGLSKGSFSSVSGSVSARWHSFGELVPSWLYAGAGLDFNRFSYSTSVSFNGLGDGASTVEFHIQGLYFTPQIGAQWAWASGFFVGSNAGVQLPVLTGGKLSITATSEGDPEKRASLENAATAPIGYYAHLMRPYLTLIYLGWMF